MDKEEMRLACLKIAGCHTKRTDDMVWFAEKLMRYVTNVEPEPDPEQRETWI